MESINSNTCHTLGNNGGRAPLNQGISIFINYRITAIARIVSCIINSYDYRGNTAAIIESSVININDTFGDNNGSKTATFTESVTFNTRNTLRYSNNGKISATLKSRVSNTCHTIHIAIIVNSRGNFNSPTIFILIVIIKESFTSNLHRKVCRGGNVVVDSIYLKVVGTCREATQ